MTDWKSGIYEGQVRHRRMSPAPHEFSYRMFMMFLDLSELPQVFAGRWFWSDRAPALARFRREDHFGDPAVPLDQSVRDLVEQETGARPQGPIRLLTHLRYFGFVFNPVSFYYCFDNCFAFDSKTSVLYPSLLKCLDKAFKISVFPVPFEPNKKPVSLSRLT